MKRPPWPVDADGQPLPQTGDGKPDYAAVNWPKAGKHWADIGDDGRPYVAPARRSMRLPAFVILVGVIVGGVLAFGMTVHDNYGQSCGNAFSAVTASRSSYDVTSVNIPSSPYFDASGINAQAQANQDAILQSKIDACHSNGTTRLIIAGGIIIGAVILSRFVPDVGQRVG